MHTTTQHANEPMNEGAGQHAITCSSSSFQCPGRPRGTACAGCSDRAGSTTSRGIASPTTNRRHQPNTTLCTAGAAHVVVRAGLEVPRDQARLCRREQRQVSRLSQQADKLTVVGLGCLLHRGGRARTHTRPRSRRLSELGHDTHGLQGQALARVERNRLPVRTDLGEDLQGVRRVECK